ncbi:MAG: PKD domain-containing protein, partial [Bacteroidetes bacterium]|nr:PKD domain-containing protein [Bacteroidota bacterium]
MKNSKTGNRQSYFRTLWAIALIVFCSSLQSKAQIPTASFSADSTEGCVPLTVHFSNTSIHATSFFWDFGNGNTSTLPNPQTVYLNPGSYTVTLIAHNSVSGRSDTLVMPSYITVVSFPVADFTSNVTSGCSPLTVNFTNNSANYTTCVWDFGDGFSSTQTNPSHTYSIPGYYTVKLIAYSAYGCSNVKTKLNYIRVYDKPTAQLSVAPSSSCDPNQVFQFSSSSTGITNYTWNFGQPSSGGANTSTLANPTHVYGTQGTFSVNLIVEDNNGCRDTAVANNLINIGTALTPTFTWNKSSGCKPLTVQFTPPSITGVTSYLWNFGDPTSGAQNTSSSASPSHTFASAGTYSVSLFVTTSSGCNGGVTLNNIITVDQPPVAAFNANQTTGCKPFTVQFNNLSSGATSYLWEFGNGTTSTLAAPSVTYTTAGTYTVRLHAYSANGCETIEEKINYITVNEIKANYSSTPRSGCSPLNVTFNSSGSTGAVSWLWDFSDPASGAANTSTLANPTHTFITQGNYIVQLIVTSASGCKDTLRKTSVTVAAPSVIYTVPDTIKGCQPYPVSFINPLTGATFFHWDFGVPWLTNDTSNKANPTFVFDSAGVYTVTLTATMGGNNGNGCSQVFNPIAIVEIFPMIISPITYVQATPCAPYLIHFSDTTSDVIHWDWNFGDGSPHDTTQFPTHTYTQPGTYTVSLNIVLASGCMTSLSTVITLGKTNPIKVNKKAGCNDEPFNFGLTGGPWSNVSWNFGDGIGTSTSQSPSYTYNIAGDFIVTLNATGSDGCAYTFHDTISTTNPQPSFVINGPTSGCDKLIVYFTNTSTGATSYLWDFGDPSSSSGYSTLENPSRKFSTPKSYTITLTATNGACSHSVSYPALINIYAAKPNFSFTQSSQCFPITVQLTDLTGPVPAVQWGWNFYNGVTDSTKNPTYTYPAPPAVDSISLWVRDTNGCTAVKKVLGIKYKQAKFSVSSAGGCKPVSICFTDKSDTTAISWKWNFGDGSTSTTRNPCHTYTADGSYTVTLITTFSTGCKDTLVVPNAVNISSPHADFSAPVVAFCAPALVNFNNLSTNATSYYWDFGDGSNSIASTPSHVYNIPGDYTVTLTAINGSCRDTMRKVNYLHVPGTSSYFNLTSLQSCVGNMVSFTDSSLNAQSWLWNFGDGDSSTLQNPSHLYSSTGSYTVSLITSDTLGCSSHYIFNNPIVVHPVPTAIASTKDTVGCNAFTASFTQNSLNASSYFWNFGNPASGVLNTDTSSAPTHTYTSPGSYQVYLVATNIYGCSDTFWLPKKINIKSTPKAKFTNTPSSGCTPLTVSFNNTSTSLNNPTYLWNFGNGATSGVASPQYTYADSGKFVVSLIVTNSGGCSDTAKTTITSTLSPTALAATSDTAGCTPFSVNFTNSSTNAVSYLWNFGNGATSTQANPTYTYYG